MTNISELLNALEKIAPQALAAKWDPVGLQIGDNDCPSDKVLLTIDLIDEVINEAINLKINTIISYHPPIFKPLKKLTSSSKTGRLALACARNNIAVISPHTALDCIDDGIGARLAKMCGEGCTKPIGLITPEPELSKIIVFSPPDNIDKIRNTLSKIGAGKIGNYEYCSFLTKGSGSFLGNNNAIPFLGSKNKITFTNEERLEMIVPNNQINLAIDEVRKIHPYEEPALDIIPIKPLPIKNAGKAWMQTLKTPKTAVEILYKIKKNLDIDSIRFAKSKMRCAGDLITRIAVCPGSGNDLFLACKEAGAELFITGEMRYHDLLQAIDEPIHVGLTGHSNSERFYLPILKEKISLIIPSIEILISKKDTSIWKTLFTDPFEK